MRPPPIFPKLRLARLMTCARLWLVWLMAQLAAIGSAPIERWLRERTDDMALGIGWLIVLHAWLRLPRRAAPARNRRHGRLKTRGLRRAIVGSALRRALRARGAAARIAALSAIVANPEPHIARLARRLRRGLSRLRTIAPVRARAVLRRDPEKRGAPLADTS